MRRAVSLDFRALVFASWGRREQSLWMLTTGQWNLLRSFWKFLEVSLSQLPQLTRMVIRWCRFPDHRGAYGASVTGAHVVALLPLLLELGRRRFFALCLRPQKPLTL
ncbi:hypothetical protein VNO80_29392 [Phaseolus coccineus]|uniref:Uncharacterized protein n=1 Tax=Phaseolus coccineus TaxID=3886 RepID=A0AAN9LAV9_PHACN